MVVVAVNIKSTQRTEWKQIFFFWSKPRYPAHMGRLILFEAGPGVKVLNLSQRRCGGSNRGPPYQVQPLAPLNQQSVGA